MERWFADLSGSLAAASPHGDGHAGVGLAALGWATVDHERTLQALGDLTFEAGVRDELLGAHAWRMQTGRIELYVLEPSTEGRLAGYLARWGEGLAVLYLEPADGDLAPQAAARIGITPLGRTGHVVAGPREGPFVVILEPVLSDVQRRLGEAGGRDSGDANE